MARWRLWPSHFTNLTREKQVRWMVMVAKEVEAMAESFTEASFCSFSSSLSTCKACEALGRPGGRHMYTPESFT